MKLRHILMTAGLIGSAALVWLGDNSPELSEAVVPAKKTAQSNTSANSSLSAPRSTQRNPSAGLIPDGKAEFKAESKSAKSAKSSEANVQVLALVSRNIPSDSMDAPVIDEKMFAAHSWTPPPPPAPPPPPPPPVSAPTAPALPFVYIGKTLHLAENRWEVYVTQGDRTIVVQNNMVIDGIYRVDQIAPPQLKLTYLPLNQAQTLNIGGTD